MNEDSLRAFLAILKLGGFRKAAESLHLAQPSLSQHVHRLESELGVKLFDRSRRPVQLTGPGRAFVARAEGILRAIEDSVSEMRDFDDKYGGTVAVGAMQYLAYLELPDLLADFRVMYPNADLHLRIGNTGEVRSLLIHDEIDVGILHSDGEPLPSRFAVRKLRSERLVLITGLDDPLARREPIDWTDLSETRFIVFRHGASIHDALKAQTDAAGFTPRTALESADIATAVTFVARGLGVALVPESLAKRELSRVAILQPRSGPVPLRTVSLAWDKSRYTSRTTQRFMSHAVEFIR